MEEQFQIPEQEQEPKIMWGKKRQLVYIAWIFGVLVVLSTYPIFKLFNTPPTCFDDKQNQLEVGIDCGGPCDVRCGSQVENLAINWAEAFMVSDGVYDLTASIENPNLRAGIKEISYIFKVYDTKNFLIAEKTGITFINPRDKFVVFESNIQMKEGKIPEKVVFEFKENPVWVKMEKEAPIVTIKNKKLINIETSPRLNATILNNSVDDFSEVEIVAVVYDKKGNPIAVSSTYEEDINRDSSKDIFLTWTSAFTTKPKIGCTAPTDVMLVFDRSGSMGFGGQNPPQPLTSAKNAALSFVDGMQVVDQVGLVSFAAIASDPVDQNLTSLKEKVKEAIESIIIFSPASEQHTNIGDGVEKATLELLSSRSNSRAKKAIVLLTDGVASRPLNPEKATDKEYPKDYAREKSEIVRDNEISLYVIGLGNGVNEEFLSKDIATTPSYYYKAATSAELKNIYDEIALAVCEEETFITDIMVHVKNINGAR